ncbi:MAG: carboxymethylenebutenolidase [Acidobacteriota bacterium]|jgi:carboxymethylenebutenolidase|nr:carboxymethylenebutenolidase [Acidobacteriota bacterium]
MIVSTEYVDIPVNGSFMRSFVATPKERGNYPGVLCYSDIFQLTGPMLRSCIRLAGYGFVVVAPEIYHRIEPPGLVIPFDDAGRTRGLEDAAKTSVADFDADCRAAITFLTHHPYASLNAVAAAGFCIGGHLAFRAAFQPEVKATVAFYGTGIHNGKLGSDADAGSLERSGEIRGRLLLVWGSLDPHVPVDARRRIAEKLPETGVEFSERLYAAEHAFMRDEGPRFDPQATDLAFGDMINFFEAAF